MRKLILLAVLAFIVSACGGGSDEPRSSSRDVRTNPTQTRGSLVGQVETWVGMPLSDVSVSVLLLDGLRTTTTDADGRFVLSDLPAGSYLVIRFEAEGFVPAEINTRISNRAEESPLDGALNFVGPIMLFPSDGRLEIEIVGSLGERLTPPSAVCVVHGTWVNRYGGADELQGTLVRKARFEDGRMICDELPSLDLLLYFGAFVGYSYAPIDEDGDGRPEYQGRADEVSLGDLVLEGRQRWQEYARPWADEQDLEIIASNVSNLMDGDIEANPLAPDAAIEVLFSRPIDFHRAEVTARIGDGSLEVEAEVEGAQLRLLPADGAWPEGFVLGVSLLVTPTGEPFEATTFEGDFLTTTDEEFWVRATFFDTNSDGQLTPGETLEIEFSHHCFVLDQDEPFNIPVQFALDLDSSGTIGDATGEEGYTTAYLFDAPPDSGYRYFAKKISGILAFAVPAGTEIVLPYLPTFAWGCPSNPLVTEEIRVELLALEML